MRNKAVLVVVALGGLASSSALGQSLNIDYHDSSGTPDVGYAAAGAAGFWNALSGPAGLPESLAGLDGLPIAATVTQTGAVGTQNVPNNNTGEHLPLLNDRILSTSETIHLDFENLLNGTYEVYTYCFAKNPNDVTITLNDDVQTAFDYVTGWNGDLELGVTHAMHLVAVTDGTLRISIDFPGDDPAVNGVQLVLIPAPASLPVILLAAAIPAGRRRRSGCR